MPPAHLKNTDIIVASTESHYAIARQLFLDYAAELNIDLCFQGFEDELDNLQRHYGPENGGFILLLQEAGSYIGCIGLRRLDEATGEVKRLFVKNGYRGKGHSKLLTTQLIDRAAGMGYCKLRLDTLPAMKAAIGLYQKIGFREIAPYHSHPVEGALFMELNLSDPGKPET